jgi:hypothetical protein
MTPLKLARWRLTAPVVVMVIEPPRSRGGVLWLPRPSTSPPGAMENEPARTFTELERISSSPLPRMVTARVPKSSVQPSPISKTLPMLQAPVPLGHRPAAPSFAMMSAAVQAGIA